MRVCLEHRTYRGMHILGGYRLEELDGIQNMLKEFWARYRFHEPDVRPRFPHVTLPLFIHGDEGRGQVKRPLMIISVQFVLGLKKEESNNKGCLDSYQ